MKYQSIVILTGAGISAESGLATFRDSDGLWEKHRIEDVATPEAFAADPGLVWRFYSARRTHAALASPNAAHLAIARFCKTSQETGTDVLVVSQNVDGLHERAHQPIGAPPPLAMHGTLSKSRCSGCDRVFDDSSLYTDPKNLPRSQCCQELIRPHIVWFGEMPLHLDEIQEKLKRCDLFITIGTSGNVYPAAGFLNWAKIAGAKTVCLNKEPIPQHAFIDEFIEGPASETVPRFFQGLG